jgi:hypothetical protein
MTAWLVLIGTIAVAALLFAALRNPVRKYLAARGDRVVTCPDNQQTAAVRVDAVHAALGGGGAPAPFRLETCSRWPEKAGCGQECLAQIAAQPTDCLVRTQVDRWYADKVCALCGKALGGLDWTRHKPALRRPDGVTLEWAEVKADTLPDVLATHAAVCWDCHVAETFRRTRPDLVIDAPPAPTRPAGA